MLKKDNEEANSKDRALHRSDLSNPESPAILGLIITRQLIEYGQASTYIDSEGFIKIASPGELSLDGLPEPMAITTLAEQGWIDDEIEGYLRGRDARLARG